MLLKLAHHIASNSWVYDRIQKAAGVDRVYARLAPHLSKGGGQALVLDIGGGTGTLQSRCSPSDRYVCLDIDWEKLRGFRAKDPAGAAIMGDATRLPVADSSVDTAICMFIAHHADDGGLIRILGEVERTLRPRGRLILLDPVFDRDRLAGRILWNLDRGAFPRTPAALKGALEERFDISHWDEFAVWHRYVLGVLHKRGQRTAP